MGGVWLPAQVEAAVTLNEESGLRALQLSLLGLAARSLLAIIPAGRMQGRLPGELPEDLAATSVPVAGEPPTTDRD